MRLVRTMLLLLCLLVAVPGEAVAQEAPDRRVAVRCTQSAAPRGAVGTSYFSANYRNTLQGIPEGHHLLVNCLAVPPATANFTVTVYDSTNVVLLILHGGESVSIPGGLALENGARFEVASIDGRPAWVTVIGRIAPSYDRARQDLEEAFRQELREARMDLMRSIERAVQDALGQRADQALGEEFARALAEQVRSDVQAVVEERLPEAVRGAVEEAIRRGRPASEQGGTSED